MIQPIGSMVLLYMVTWIPSIYPLYVSTYTSTMDPSWARTSVPNRVGDHDINKDDQQRWWFLELSLGPRCGVWWQVSRIMVISWRIAILRLAPKRFPKPTYLVGQCSHVLSVIHGYTMLYLPQRFHVETCPMMDETGVSENGLYPKWLC